MRSHLTKLLAPQQTAGSSGPLERLNSVLQAAATAGVAGVGDGSSRPGRAGSPAETGGGGAAAREVPGAGRGAPRGAGRRRRGRARRRCCRSYWPKTSGAGAATCYRASGVGSSCFACSDICICGGIRSAERIAARRCRACAPSHCHRSTALHDGAQNWGLLAGM